MRQKRRRVEDKSLQRCKSVQKMAALLGANELCAPTRRWSLPMQWCEGECGRRLKVTGVVAAAGVVTGVVKAAGVATGAAAAAGVTEPAPSTSTSTCQIPSGDGRCRRSANPPGGVVTGGPVCREEQPNPPGGGHRRSCVYVV